MTMELYALCARPIADVSEWQSALDACGFDLRLRAEKIPPASKGHLPAVWRGHEAGFECGSMSVSELRDDYSDVDLGGPWACVYAFYFATYASCAGALMAAAACVRVTDGVAYDPQENRLMTAEQVVRCARDTVAAIEQLDTPSDSKSC
jgi:hypothetical protein